MKWLIASDIHGSAKWCRKLLERYPLAHRAQGKRQRTVALGNFDLQSVKICGGPVDPDIIQDFDRSDV